MTIQDTKYHLLCTVRPEQLSLKWQTFENLSCIQLIKSIWTQWKVAWFTWRQECWMPFLSLFPMDPGKQHCYWESFNCLYTKRPSCDMTFILCLGKVMWFRQRGEWESWHPHSEVNEYLKHCCHSTWLINSDLRSAKQMTFSLVLLLTYRCLNKDYISFKEYHF